MDGLISLVKIFEDSVSQKPLGPDCGPPIIHCTYVSFPVRFVCIQVYTVRIQCFRPPVISNELFRLCLKSSQFCLPVGITDNHGTVASVKKQTDEFYGKFAFKPMRILSLH